MLEALGRSVRDSAPTSELASDIRWHVCIQHGGTARVHVQGRGACITELLEQLPEGCRVPAGQGTEH